MSKPDLDGLVTAGLPKGAAQFLVDNPAMVERLEIEARLRVLNDLLQKLSPMPAKTKGRAAVLAHGKRAYVKRSPKQK